MNCCLTFLYKVSIEKKLFSKLKFYYNFAKYLLKNTKLMEPLSTLIFSVIQEAYKSLNN